MAEAIEPGDRIVFYVTGVQAFGGIVRVTGEMYEDREKLWPGKPGKADPYPWRFETEPELVLDEEDFVPAEGACARARARAQVARGALAPGLPGPAAHGHRRGRRAARAQAARGGARGGVSAERIRTLLLRGDNLLKSGRPERLPRAVEAFEQAARAGQRPGHGRSVCASSCGAGSRRPGPSRNDEALPPLLPGGGDRAAAARDRADRPDARRSRPARRRRGAGGAGRRGRTNGGGQPGRTVSEGFLELRESMSELRDREIVLRDLDRGLVDFPALRDSRRSTCVGWRARRRSASGTSPSAGFAGRRPLDDG